MFIEMGGQNDPVVLRAINYATQQHVVGVVHSINTHGQWLDTNEWEAGINGDMVAGAKGRKVVP